MELDERKKKILNALIENYLETGEPVGSRTISKSSDLSLSSATIRNEMADLEEMGLIVQPHTSAGRIPTDEGYRFYVESLLNSHKIEVNKKERQIKAKQDEIDDLRKMLNSNGQVDDVMQNLAGMLAENTNYATVVMSSYGDGNRIKFIQLSKLEENKILVVVVLEGNYIRNKVFLLDNDITNEAISNLNIMINTSIAGLTTKELEKQIQLLGESDNSRDKILCDMYSIIVDTIHNTDDVHMYTSGTTNIFRYPELSVSDTARELITTFEKKHALSDFMNNNSDGTGIKVYIGKETSIEAMKDCSIITATYDLSNGVKGTIGIIGPKRMDYEMVLETLNNIRLRLDDLFDK
ncbi:heat-inducible transcriptional repressor HrcA [Howardella ureilytica]|nr:heat-inducible transcriptional repressor HrcA [Lachnospiraceae bacterium]MDY2956606.1 heat-inducible transcriptional repressor HrcA [Lachnospiraceae bacterium]